MAGRGECRRGFWWTLLTAIIVVGILSRMTQTGSVIVDKYLGDALYAAMVYVLFRLTGHVEHVATWTMVAMTAIELWQITGIPALMFRSSDAVIRLFARLMGTQFGVLDLLAYAVGIGCIGMLDRTLHRLN